MQFYFNNLVSIAARYFVEILFVQPLSELINLSGRFQRCIADVKVVELGKKDSPRRYRGHQHEYRK